MVTKTKRYNKEIVFQYEIKTIDSIYLIVRYSDGTSDIVETTNNTP
ncbi:MAG: hypothetical protein ACQEXQ_07600 [Bacillota bacterium]